ncbi:hypothetical protein V6N12_068913 [Hibiscus sabdariffa]|uniref:Uncharacterized protein n=1 Tax=Hibiscus sabdariffa TaxID=183260 RepID=A0ABR2CA77_9ROSI
MVDMKRQSKDVCNQLCPLEHLPTGKIEIPSQPKVWVLGDIRLQTKFGGGGYDLQEQPAQFTNLIQSKTYKEEDDTHNCGRLANLAFHGEKLKAEALSDKIVGLGTLFAIDSNFHVEQLSNIWKTQHEELNSIQLYRSACPFIVEKEYKCEIDKLNGVTSNSKDVDSFGRNMVQGIRIETTFNIYSYTIANRYTKKRILNLGAAGVIASPVCNQLILHDSDYKIVALDKLEHCSSLKNLDISRSSNFKFLTRVIYQKLCEKQSIPFEYGRGLLEQLSQFLADIQTVMPTHVSNAIGVIGRLKVDWCETHKIETIRTTNVVDMLTLVDICKEDQLLVINYATGATHLLGMRVGFKKEDKPKFTGSVYSKIKAMVEEVLREFDSVCTFKVQIPISSDFSNARNFITKITRYNHVVDILNSLTMLDELLPVSIEMVKRNLEDKISTKSAGKFLTMS